jgi:hypothetical protein
MSNSRNPEIPFFPGQRHSGLAECANTNEFFDAGDDDESLDGVEFEEPSPAEAPEKASEDPADNSIPL